MTHRILMLGSVPLAAPWNGADKNLAGLLVRWDPANRFIVQTDEREPWPANVLAVRERRAHHIPTTGQKLRALGYLARHTAAADMVHVVASLARPAPGAGQILRIWPKLRRRPIIHTAPSIGDGPVRRENFFGDLTVVVSEHTRRRLIDHGVPGVVRVFPPVDVERLRPKTPPAELAAAHKLGPRALLYPAHYGPHSGIAEMIAAFARLPAELHDAVLVLACRTHANQDPAEEAAKVRAAAAQAGVGDRVRVLGNIGDMPGLIQACAVTALLPAKLVSKMDLPLVVLEALALERPVIIGDTPPLSESLLAGAGRTVPFGDIGALAVALTELLSDEGLRRRLGAEGAAAVLRECRPERVVAEYQQIYERVARKHELAV